MKRKKSFLIFFALLLVAPFQVWATPEKKPTKIQNTLTDSMSGSTFEELYQIDEKEFQCLGAGGHKILFYKIYADSFCIEKSTSLQPVHEYIQKNYSKLSKGHLAKALEGDESFFSLLASLPGDKLLQIRFLRNLKRDQVSNAMVKALKNVLPPQDVERVGEAFRARNPSKNDLALIFSQGDSLHLRMADSTRILDQVPTVVEEIWLVWIGKGTPTPNLRRDIARRFASQDRNNPAF